MGGVASIRSIPFFPLLSFPRPPPKYTQDLLKNEYDAAKLRHFLTVEVLIVNASSASSSSQSSSSPSSGPPRLLPQSAGGRLVRDLQSSPCGRFVLAQVTTDFSYSVPIGRFGRDVEIWSLPSSSSSPSVVAVASVPVDDEIPLSYDACSRHPRKFHFHPCRDHSIVYAVATDGGLGLNERFVGGEERDAVYCRDLDAGTMALGGPAKLVGLEWRYSDLDYMEAGLGIVEEYRWSDRMERRWILDEKAGGGTKRLLYERTWEDRYTAPGRPLMRRGSRGQFFIVQPTLKSMYLQGSGASPLGDRPFLDLLDFSTEDAKTTRLWRSAAPLESELDATKEVNGVLPTERKDIYESLVCLLKDNNSIMISR